MIVLPVVQMTMNSAVHTMHTFPPSQLILGTNMRLPIDCQLPSAIQNQALLEKEQVQRLKAALAMCQQVAQCYVDTRVSGPEPLHTSIYNLDIFHP